MAAERPAANDSRRLSQREARNRAEAAPPLPTQPARGGADAAPVRLCCMQRHQGSVCPDGKVMCCLCFGRFDVADLSVTEDGTPEDVCRACAAMEAEANA